MKRRIALALAAAVGLTLIVALTWALPAADEGNKWMVIEGPAVHEHAAARLADGRVLVCGGSNRWDFPWYGCELWDPANGQWTLTGGPRSPLGLRVTLLQDSRVLATGGHSAGGARTSQVYDPTTAVWAYTHQMNFRRGFGHTTTLLSDGRVLVAGGCSCPNGCCAQSSAEVFEPTTGRWTETGGLGLARSGHTATLLLNGQVLVVGGGSPGTSAELYDPGTGQWTATGSLGLARSGHTATLLLNGQVLVAGGSSPGTSAELYDPATGQWTPTGSLGVARSGHTATLLPDGHVLVVGPGSSTELYEPATAQWTQVASLQTRHYGHTATLLLDGQVLAVGGAWDEDWHLLSEAELYGPYANTLHLNHLKTNWKPWAPGVNKAIGLALVHDDNHGPVAGAMVSGEWILPDGTVQAAEGTTDGEGLARLVVKSGQTGLHQMCVTNVELDGYAYTPAVNDCGPCTSLLVGP
jgi:hypothetical protein